MKYKLLLDGRNRTRLNDFFMYGTEDYECMSTSIYWEDIVAHMDYFKPDAWVCFYEEDDDEIINRIRALRSYKRYMGSSVIVIADEESSMALAKKAYGLVDLTIQRPITTEKMFSTIKTFLKRGELERELKQKEEEAKTSASAQLDALMKEAGISDQGAVLGQARKKHILVVDDDRSILKLLKSALGLEYDVTTVLNGRMAEKFLATKKTDLILLDYEMPIETGPQVLQHLRAEEETAQIPVVFMTGVASRSKIQEVMLLGPQGYLLKPVDMDKLYSTIKKIIG